MNLPKIPDHTQLFEDLIMHMSSAVGKDKHKKKKKREESRESTESNRSTESLLARLER